MRLNYNAVAILSARRPLPSEGRGPVENERCVSRLPLISFPVDRRLSQLPQFDEPSFDVIVEITSICRVHVGSLYRECGTQFAKVTQFENTFMRENPQRAETTLKGCARDRKGVGACIRRNHSLSPVIIQIKNLVELGNVASSIQRTALFTQTSVVNRHCPANYLDNVAKHPRRRAVDRHPVQMIQLVEEPVHDVVAEVGVAHGVRDRCDQISNRDDRQVDPLPRFPVFHHAEAIAA